MCQLFLVRYKNFQGVSEVLKCKASEIEDEGAYQKRCTEQSRSVRDWVRISKATWLLNEVEAKQFDTYETPPFNF